MWDRATIHMFTFMIQLTPYHVPTTCNPMVGVSWHVWHGHVDGRFGLNIFIPWIGNIDVYLFTSTSLIPEIKLPRVLWAFFWKTCHLTPVSPTDPVLQWRLVLFTHDTHEQTTNTSNMPKINFKIVPVVYRHTKFVLIISISTNMKIIKNGFE